MYLLIKAIHIISVVAWFAGLFYIFRLFVYHAANKGSTECCRMLSIMERKLLIMIMAPAAVLTISLGALLLWLNPALLSSGWIWAKILLVLFLLAYHGLSIHTHRNFTRAQWIFSERECRIINEVPTLLLVAIVFLAVLKPF